MSTAGSPVGKSVLIGFSFALFIAFGLTPLAWLFYELSHTLNLTGLYSAYSSLRGLAYIISLRPDAVILYLLSGLVAAVISYIWLRLRTNQRSSL